MSIADLRIVQKPFMTDRLLHRNEVVDVSEWRNLRGLEGGRYIRRPVTDEDFKLIDEHIERISNPENWLDIRAVVTAYAQEGLKAKEISDKLKTEHGKEIHYLQIGKLLKDNNGGE